MAEAVVSFVLEKIGEFLVDSVVSEALFLCGVNDQVELAKGKLKQMLSFLRDADARVRGGNGNESLRSWVAEIREATYDLQDALATLASEAVPRRTGGVKNFAKRCACIMNEGVKLHMVRSKIEGISARISVLGTYLQTYDLRKLDIEESANYSNEMAQRELRRAYSHVIDRDIVGFEENIKELVAHLTTKGKSYRVLSITGMGGLGKTTLARKIYQHCNIRSHFDCLAWASISQQCQVSNVWKEILVKLCVDEKEKIKEMEDSEIARRLYDVQKQRKCLVILDDIWTTEMWDRLKATFPEDQTHSKILLTTRNKDLALYADRNGIIHEPRCLDANESWELFQKAFTVGQSTSAKDGKRKKELGKKMLKYCAGLPLAIIVLRELLSRKQTVFEWEVLLNNAKMYINKGKVAELRDSKNLGVSWVLGLSYDELPYLLKPCFLHLAHFPEDYELRVDELCHMWMAEGFVSSENVAYEFLLELIQRSMVQRGVLGSIDERVKTCRIHDLMRDLCLSKAQEENFLQIIDISENSQETMDSLSACKVRRLSLIHLNTDNVSDHKLLSIIKEGCLRSFTCFDSCFGPKIVKPWFDFFYMLRVLKLEGRYLYVANLPKEIGKLIHLRFLSFKETQMVSLPSSIRNLTCLQTLDLRVINKISIVTKSIKREKILGCEELLKKVVMWRLEHLRHLYLPSYFQLSRGNQLLLEHASNLQTLVNISVSYPALDKILQRTTLTKLKVYFNKSWDGGIQCNHLHSLTVKLALHGNYVNRDIVPIISSCPELYELKVTGAIDKLPNDNQFSLNLIKLSLKDMNLESDPMPTLEKLPNLRVLFLKNALQVDELVCSRGGFPRLEYLCFYELWIKEWRVDEGSLPCLLHLSLQACWKLGKIPEGLAYITTLNEIVLQRMPREFIRRIKKDGVDFYKVQHVPSLVILDTINDEGIRISSNIDEDNDESGSVLELSSLEPELVPQELE